MLTEAGDGTVRTSYVRLCDLAGCERARATRNTGARMLESRAINSSLHVLERCLHMLRRKQRMRNDAMVPYRESKLTRLLGTGLSGTRGEAVSMVVTLNPSPEYAHETKHVLSLAAVAQDIQINNTMLLSTLESSTQDTTVNCSSEVMKLRSDNERLHFELVQAQARNRELLATMEEHQQESANTMREVVEEAKDLTKQYYEAQLEALRSEMEDMVEEYESRLAKIPVLEEKLTAERLARARAEEEVEHLRTCIEERDEKAFKDKTPSREDVMSLSDSEHESDGETNDPLNESLEPLFKKDLNRSVSIVIHNDNRDNASVHTIDNIDEENDSDIEKSHETLKNDRSRKSSYATGEDNDDSNVSVKKIDEVKDSVADVTETFDESVKTDTNVTYDNELTDKCDESMKNNSNTTYNSESTCDRYAADPKTDSRDADDEMQSKNESIKSTKHEVRGTYFVSESKISENGGFSEVSKEKLISSFRGTYFVKSPVIKASQNVDRNEKDSATDKFKVPIVDQPYADTKVKEPEIKIVSKQKENVNTANTMELPINKITRGKSNIDMKAPVKSEPVAAMMRAKTNLNMKSSEKVSETLVGKIIRSFKTNHGSDASLRQFEQLEIASKEDDDDKQNQSVFGNIKILKEKRTYFDNVLDNNNKPKDDCKEEIAVVKEKRTYFDNISANVDVCNKNVYKLQKIDDDRSPSIVKEIVNDDFEPSTIRKLLGESFTKPDVISSIHKSKITKKHDSVDIFDGFDSPIAPKAKEKVDNVEMARQSIEKLVLDQLSVKKGKANAEPRLSIREIIEPEDNEVQINIKKEIKLEPMSSVEETNDNIRGFKKDAKLEPASSTDEPNQTVNDQTRSDNTIDEFENIYKNISAPRATEFDLLVSQEANESTEKHDKDDVKYNLRKKKQSHHTKNDDEKSYKEVEEVILAESHAKCESKARKRPLRLRRKKNQDDDSDDKLKDIVNLQSEFSDVTMGVPAPKKDVKDIPSPEKALDENLPPSFGIQSCPSKMNTRNRRKLFTPRAEPLEESITQTGNSDERIYVPRPSYHRPRARRKL